MTSVKHKFVTVVTDDPISQALGEVLPSHWNDEHSVSIAAADITAAGGLTSVSFASAIAGYVTSTSLATALATYVTSDSISARFASLTLDAIVGVSLSQSIQDGQVLAWNNTSNQWINQTPTAPVDAVGSASLATLLATYVTSQSLSTALGGYLTSVSASAKYVSSASLLTALSPYITSASISTALVPYLTSASAATVLATYVTSSSLATALSPYLTSASASAMYVTSNSLSLVLTGYVTSLSLSTALGAYISSSSLLTALSPYITSNSVSIALVPYITSNSVSIALVGYVTSSSLVTALGGYVTSASLATYNASLTLDAIVNVSLSGSVQDGQVLTWNNTANQWINANAATGGASLTLDQIIDISLSHSVQQGQVLTWNNTANQWTNQTPVTGGSHSKLDGTGGFAGNVFFKMSGAWTAYQTLELDIQGKGGPSTTNLILALYTDGGTTPFLTYATNPIASATASEFAAHFLITGTKNSQALKVITPLVQMFAGVTNQAGLFPTATFTASGINAIGICTGAGATTTTMSSADVYLYGRGV